MNTQPVSLKEILQRKLHPSRFPRLTGGMAAVVGYILDAPFIDPPIAELTVTPDEAVLARVDGEAQSRFLGSYWDLLQNYFGLQNAARLTGDERMALDALFASKIGFLGPTMA